MPLYCGIDLHAKTSYIAIVDEQRRRIFKRNLPNDKKLILGFLEPYKPQLEGVVVESTFNWYWLAIAPDGQICWQTPQKQHLSISTAATNLPAFGDSETFCRALLFCFDVIIPESKPKPWETNAASTARPVPSRGVCRRSLPPPRP